MNKTRGLAIAAVTGAAYAVFTILLAPISYGVIQFRLSEVLCILPFFLPSTSWGLFLGCALANLVTGNLFDVLFGSLATLLASLVAAQLGRKGRSVRRLLAACAMPVIFNALVIGAVITQAYSGLSLWQHPLVFAANAAWIALGEAVVMFVLAYPLSIYFSQRPFFMRICRECGSSCNLTR